MTSAPGERPRSSANSPTSAPQTPFTVPMRAVSIAAARSGRPVSVSFVRIRPASSAAARTVKVVASSRAGSSPSATAAWMRSTSA
jgi:hypothetical protein